MSAVQEAAEYTPAELASMTPEERAAIGVELDDKEKVELVEEGAAGSPQAVEAAAAVETARIAAAAAAAAAKPAVETPAVVVPPVEPSAPAAAAVVVPPVEGEIPDAVDPIGAKVTRHVDVAAITDEAHAAAQTALTAKFEAGDITTPQFIIENEKLTRAKITADSAASSSVQDEAATWQARQDAFFNTSGNAIIRDDPRVWAAMQAQLEAQYIDPKCKDFTDMQHLNAAGREVRTLFGIQPAAKPAATPAAAAAPGSALSSVPLPKTLEGVPAAADNADGGEFGHMDKLEGMDYENAVARMTPEQKARFLA